MIYIRGNRLDYNTWRDEYGCDGWGYNEILPYFRRAEENGAAGRPYHGGSARCGRGPAVQAPADPRLVESAMNARRGRQPDFNGAEPGRRRLLPAHPEGGRRWSAADGYLHPAEARPNLTVVTDALATRVVIEGGRAVGVTVRARAARRVARPRREVVLCGGAVNSPQLLMLSGVGPADQLR